MQHHSKPEPRADGLNAEFYANAANHELRFQKCGTCGTWRHMPRHTCAECGSPKWSWERSSGRGKLYSWTVTHRAFHPGFDHDIPYAVAVVELEEGVRMVSQIEDLAIRDYTIGAPLVVTFADRGGYKLPMFRPA
jgi:uncharacterized OB-fold protein